MMFLLESTGKTWMDKISNAVDNILVPILVIACSVGMVYAIVVGIKMMKAESADDRKENKSKLINIAISIVAIAVMISLFYALRNWLGSNEGQKEVEKGFGFITDVGSPLNNTFNLVKQCARLLVFKC